MTERFTTTDAGIAAPSDEQSLTSVPTARSCCRITT